MALRTKKWPFYLLIPTVQVFSMVFWEDNNSLRAVPCVFSDINEDRQYMTSFPNASSDWTPTLLYPQFMQLVDYLGTNSTCDVQDKNCDTLEARVTRFLTSPSGMYQTVGKCTV